MFVDTITLTQSDYMRLRSLIDAMGDASEEVEGLEEELERASIIDTSEIPSDLVTMNSRFRYLNVTDGREDEMTIVYPHQANAEKKCISVTAALGSAMLGLRVSDEIDWTFPDGRERRLRVLEVISQPEKDGTQS